MIATALHGKMRLHGKEAQVSDSKWAGFFAVAILISSVTNFCNWLEKTNIQKQAIERGYAEYVVDSDGKITWQWKEKQ